MLDPIGTHDNPWWSNISGSGLDLSIPTFFLFYLFTGCWILCSFYHVVGRCSPYLLVHSTGGGVVQAKMILAEGSHATLLAVICRLFVTVVYVGTGHPHGIEGPTIFIGVGLVTQIAHWLGINSKEVMIMIAFIGCVAGVSVLIF